MELFQQILLSNLLLHLIHSLIRAIVIKISIDNIRRDIPTFYVRAVINTHMKKKTIIVKIKIICIAHIEHQDRMSLYG